MTATPLVTVTLALALAAPVAADPGAPPGAIQQGVRRELTRLAAAGSATPAPTPPQRRNWVQRHPKLTAALIGGGAGFAIGYLPGDDAVFDDFDATFNGNVLAGVGAVAGVSVVAIVQALRD
jgi:hypothetical protein